MSKQIKKKVTKKVTKKKTVAKKATKKKTVAKKATKKKTVAKKVAKKKTVTKKVAKKKTIAKKIAKKKTVTKKVAKKKTVTKKVAKKKTIAKKITKKKTVSKKATKKKIVAKKIAKKKTVTKKVSQSAKPNKKSTVAPKKKNLKEQIDKISKQEHIQSDDNQSPLEELTTQDIQTLIQKLDFSSTKDDDCLFKNCDNPATTMGYCRFHYIKEWKEIKSKQEILGGKRLASLIEEIIKKYPTPYIESLLSDLQCEQSFYLALRELNIESNYDELDDNDDGDLETSEIPTLKAKKSFDNE